MKGDALHGSSGSDKQSSIAYATHLCRAYFRIGDIRGSARDLAGSRVEYLLWVTTRERQKSNRHD